MKTAEHVTTQTEGTSLLSTYVGPAKVIKSAGSRVQIAFPDMTAWARMALAYPYSPEPGDSVLVISQLDNWYVIGVLEGTGKTSLCVPSDLDLKAPSGAIRLIAGKGVRVDAPEVRLRAERLAFAAQSLVETFANVKRRVRDSLEIRAGRMKTRVAALYRLKAGRIAARTKEDVKIDGRKIHLG